MAKSKSKRILVTPSAYAKQHYLYVQEVGSLKSIEPHISSRKDLHSYLFFLVRSGHGTLTYLGEKKELSSGDCVWIDCRNAYSHESSETDPWELSWVHFSGADADTFYESYREQGNPPCFHPAGTPAFLEILDALYDACERQDYLFELNAHRLLTALIWQAFAPTREKNDSTGEKLAQIRKYIAEHYNQKITLDSLAAQFYISKYHLSREYHKLFGQTIVEEITARRISRAKSELRFTAKPLEEIAEECGFLDCPYFIHVFKKSEGLTPLQFRKKW